MKDKIKHININFNMLAYMINILGAKATEPVLEGGEYKGSLLKETISPLYDGLMIHNNNIPNIKPTLISGQFLDDYMIQKNKKPKKAYVALDLLMAVNNITFSEAMQMAEVYMENNYTEIVVKELEAPMDLNYIDEKGKIIPYKLALHIVENNSILTDAGGTYILKDGIYQCPTNGLYDYINKLIYDKKQVTVRNIKEIEFHIANMTMIDEVKQTRGYILFENGLYSIRQKTFVEHTPDIIMLGRIPFVYNQENVSIKGTNFEEFITSSLNEEMLPVIQEMIGTSIYPITDRKAYFYILFGEGRNGKGVLAKILMQLIPKDIVSNLPIGYYDKQFPPAMLQGKSLNICLDDKTTRIEEVGNFKTVTAGEQLYVEKKRKDGYQINPYLTHISLFNKLPSMNEKANAFFDRMLAIEFKTTFGTAKEVEEGTKDKVANPGLIDKILNDELEIILAWALQGLHRVIDNNYSFTITEELEQAKEFYRDNIDSVREWALTNLIPLKGDYKNSDMTPAKVLYERYLTWCEDEKLDKKVGRNTFITSMRSLFKKHYKLIHKQHMFAIFNG